MINIKAGILSTALSLIAIFIISCEKDEELQIQTGEHIEFSDAPIDLQGINAKFAKNIAYDDKERTQFDIFLPNSEIPTALVIYIHGGGFTSGDKDFAYAKRKGSLWDFPSDIRMFLNSNIAFASIRYTLLETENETEGVLKPMSDVSRALQYIRSRAEDFNIDKERIVLTGNSAGAGTSLWIGFNDDMQDEANADPVLRESTRVKGIAIRNTQATYDLNKWETDVFADYGLDLNELVQNNESFNEAVSQVYGIDDFNMFNSPEIIEYRKRVDMLALMDGNDPELWVDNTLFENVNPNGDRNIMNHHPFHARELKERADDIGLPVIAYYGMPILFEDPSGETWAEFAIRKLND